MSSEFTESIGAETRGRSKVKRSRQSAAVVGRQPVSETNADQPSLQPSSTASSSGSPATLIVNLDRLGDRCVLERSRNASQSVSC